MCFVPFCSQDCLLCPTGFSANMAVMASLAALPGAALLRKIERAPSWQSSWQAQQQR